MKASILPTYLRRSAAAVLSATLAFTLAQDARASGGEVILATDDTWDGSAYCQPGTFDRFFTRYGVSDYDAAGVICGARVREVSLNSPAYMGVLQGELRLEDPGNPGYPDIVGGLIATADAASEGPCGGDPNVPRFWTFGGGSGVPNPNATHFLIAINPPTGPGPLDCCALLLDTNGPSLGRSYPTLFNHFLEIVAFEDVPLDLSLSVTGSSRFPGDPGRPVVVTRRPNSGASVSDDEITVTLVIDNTRPTPAMRRIDVCGDKSVVNPKQGYRDMANFLTPKIGNPVTLPVGRTTITTAITSASLKSKIANLVDNRVAVNVPIVATIDGLTTTDPCVQELTHAMGADSEFDIVGLRRRSGRHDDDSAEGYFSLGSPGQAGDSLNERFREIDLPSVPFAITGLEFVGRIFGDPHPGLDALELRNEDAIFAGSPDLSGAGLLAACGTRDGVGEIPATGAAATCDVADVPLAPPLGGDLFVLAVLAPNPPGSELGIGGDTAPVQTLLADGSYIQAGALPATPFTNANFMLGFRLDGDGGTLAGDSERGERPAAPLRVIGEIVLLDKDGRRIR